MDEDEAMPAEARVKESTWEKDQRRTREFINAGTVTVNRGPLLVLIGQAMSRHDDIDHILALLLRKEDENDD